MALLPGVASCFGFALFQSILGQAQQLTVLLLQMSGVGPIQGQAHAFVRYVPEEIPYAIDRFQTEVCRHGQRQHQ